VSGKRRGNKNQQAKIFPSLKGETGKGSGEGVLGRIWVFWEKGWNLGGTLGVRRTGLRNKVVFEGVPKGGKRGIH